MISTIEFIMFPLLLLKHGNTERTKHFGEVKVGQSKKLSLECHPLIHVFAHL